MDVRFRGVSTCAWGNAPGRSLCSHLEGIEEQSLPHRLIGTKATQYLPLYHRVRRIDVQLGRVSVDSEFGFRC